MSATLAEPLRQLTRSNAEWAWGDAQQDAFHRLKGLLTSDCVVAHYNQAAETELIVDASPVGLSAILLQRSGDSVSPVAYASRTLTDVERRYSQTERRRWPLSGPVNVSIFTYMANCLPCTQPTSRWSSSTAPSQSYLPGLNDGHLDCSRTLLKLYTWWERQTQPMSSQDCRWKTSPSGKGTLRKTTSITLR